jgi:hypothetical protein
LLLSKQEPHTDNLSHPINRKIIKNLHTYMHEWIYSWCINMYVLHIIYIHIKIFFKPKQETNTDYLPQTIKYIKTFISFIFKATINIYSYINMNTDVCMYVCMDIYVHVYINIRYRYSFLTFISLQKSLFTTWHPKSSSLWIFIRIHFPLFTLFEMNEMNENTDKYKSSY